MSVSGLHIGILALIEGMTEFLPVSSTGHLILASSLIGIRPTEFTKTFEIFIQLGAILAVVFLYRKKLRSDIQLLMNVCISFLPSAFVGFLGYSFIKSYLFENTVITAIALAVGGLLLIGVEYVLQSRMRKLSEHISRKKAFIIGLFQAISVIPGVSRAAATITGGMIVGLDRKTATEFSFLLALPTIVAATGLDLVKSDLRFSQQEWFILLGGSTIAFITALITIRLFVRYVSHNSFIPFGVYRIVIAGLYAFFLLNKS